LAARVRGLDQAGGARPASAWPTSRPPRGSSRAGGRRARRTTGRGRRAGREHGLADVAPGEQRQREQEGGRQEEQAGVEAADVQAGQPEQAGQRDGTRHAGARMRRRAHRTGTFMVVV
jgi:hypothetical protein